MKSMYRLGDDLFVAMSFVGFLVGLGVRIMSASGEPLGLDHQEAFAFSLMCLLFSCALSLYDLSEKNVAGEVFKK